MRRVSQSENRKGHSGTAICGPPPGLGPGLGRSLGEGNAYLLQYSGLENSMGCIVRGVAELDTTEQVSLSLFCK